MEDYDQERSNSDYALMPPELSRIRELAALIDVYNAELDAEIAAVMGDEHPPSIMQLAHALRRSKSAAYARWLRVQRGTPKAHAEDDHHNEHGPTPPD